MNVQTFFRTAPEIPHSNQIDDEAEHRNDDHRHALNFRRMLKSLVGFSQYEEGYDEQNNRVRKRRENFYAVIPIRFTCRGRFL